MPLIKFKDMCTMDKKSIEIIVGLFHTQEFCFYHHEVDDTPGKFGLCLLVPEYGYIHSLTPQFYKAGDKNTVVDHANELNKYLRLLNAQDTEKMYALTIANRMMGKTSPDYKDND